MYCSFFGLRCPPFEDRADPQFTYATSPFEEALAALEYEAHFGQGMTLTLGEAGTGKTQLIRSLLMRLHATDHAVVVTWPAGGEMDLVRETCKGFGVTVSSSHGSVQQPARLRRHLSRNAGANHRSILIIDQAENMTVDNLSQLSTLADLKGDTGTLLNILLVGQPQFRALMNRPEFARLRQQLFGERTLSPLAPSDTAHYLSHRLRVAGAADPDLFEDQAVNLIHQAAGGIPRLINRMADAALITAYGAQVTRVTGDIAAEVTRNDTILERSMDRHEVGVASAGHYGPDRRAGATAFRPAIETVKNSYGAESLEPPGTIAAVSDEDPTADVDDPAPGDFPDADELDSSSYTPLLEPVDSFHARGEALLERLQRALARAERFTATSNASLSQFTAVEKHLHSLTARAERLIDRVGGAVRHGSDSLDQQQARVGQAVHSAQRHATRFDGQLARAAEIDSDMKEHMHRLERACERADQVESRVGSLAEQFADKADDVQERVTLLMTCLQGAENAHAKLDGLIRRTPKLLDDATQTARQLREELQEGIEKAEQTVAATTEALKKAGAVTEGLNKTLGKTEQFTDKADDVQERVTLLMTCLQGAENAHAKLEGLIQRTPKLLDDATQTARQLRGELQEGIEKAEQTVAATTQASKKAGAMTEGLNKTLAKTEQFADKADDVQERVTLLMACLQGAENAHAKLEGLIQRTPKLLDDATQTARLLREELQEGIEKAEQTVAATTEASKKAGVMTEGLNKTLGKTEQLEEQLIGRLLAKCEDRLKDRFAALEEAARGSVAEAQGGLDRIAHKATAITGDAERRLEAFDTKLKDSMAQSSRFESAFSEGAVKRFKEKLQEQLEEHLQAQDESAATILAGHRANMEDAIRMHRDQVHGLEERVQALAARGEKLASTIGAMDQDAERCKEKLQDQLQRHLRAQDETAATTLAGYRASMEDAIRVHRDQVHGLEERVQALALRGEKLASTMGAMDQDAERTVNRVHQLDQAVRTARSSVDALSDRAEKAESNLAATVNDSEKLVAGVQTARGRIEAVQQNIASTLVEIGRACERVQAAQEQAHACEQAASRLQLEHTAGASLAGKLHDTVARATQLQAALQACMTDGGSKLEQLDSHHAAALRILGELSEANATAHEAVEQTRAATASAEQAAGAAGEEDARLVTHVAEGSRVREQLAEVNSTGRQLHEAIQGSIAHADEKLAKLGAEHDAAQRLVQELHSTSAAGRDQIEDASRATCDAEQRVAEAVGKVDRLLEDAWSLSTKSQTDAAELREQSDRAAGLVATLTKSIGPGETVATQLARHMEKAGRLEQGLSEENEKAGKLAGRLADAERLLASAKEIESAAQRTAEDTRATYDNLIAESETAKNHIDRMQELSLVSRDLIDSQNRLHGEAERSSSRLNEQIANAQDAIDSGQQVLADFVNQAEMFENQLKGLADRTERMERTISEATAKPGSIVESAKFQAAKLEQVCGAVRKVFAGLSRTSLAAHQQTERMQQTGQDTSRRLTELTVQTQRAARTLQEWVGEAVRVQSRLERTLGECPSIRETHPSETIQHLSDARFPIHDIAEARSGGALKMLREPEPQTTPTEVAATQPPTRTEQVAQLIEQAKQAEPATR